MCRPNAMMKQKFLVCLTMALLLALTLFGAALAESAATIPEVNVVLSQNRFSGPGPVDVTVTVTNTAATDMPGPCALYDPTGNIIREFGQPTLKAGESRVYSGTWQVTQAHLDAGRLSFVIGYTMYDDAGVRAQKNQPIYVSIVNAGLEAKVEVSRSITPTTARKDQKVYVTYTVTNVGGVEVTDVTIKESSAIASTAAKLGALKVGETKTHTFTVTMAKKNLTSHATVTFKAAGKEDSVKVEDATIQYGDVKLSATLTADKKGGPIGDVVKLTLKLNNTSKYEIGNITVTDPVLGTVFSGLTVEKNGSLTVEKDLTITTDADLIFTVTGTNSTGSTITTATEFVHIIAVDPAKQVHLSVVTEVDKSTIYTMPGVVKFTVHVTNDSAVEATNVSVSASGVKVFPFASGSSGVTIAPGETLSFSRDVRVDYAGRFRFDANASGQLGETLTFMSNEVPIYYARPTSTPTMVPIATPKVPVTEPVPQHDGLPAYYDTAESALNIGFWVLAGVSALCLALIVIGMLGRSAKNAKSAASTDSFTRVYSEDYGAASRKNQRRFITDNGDESDSHPAVAEPEETPAPAQDAIEPEELAASMQEAMTELYPDEAQAAPEQAPAEAEPTEEVIYGRRRRSAQDE